MVLFKAITCRIVMQCTALQLICTGVTGRVELKPFQYSASDVVDSVIPLNSILILILNPRCTREYQYVDVQSEKTDCSVMQVFQLLDIRYLRSGDET
jgi:hypothetical protein